MEDVRWFEGIELYASFRSLGGAPVKMSDFAASVAQLPLFPSLGFLAGVSIEQYRLEDAEHELTSFDYQAPYLAAALEDDFPSNRELEREQITAGRLKEDGMGHVLMHPHNHAYLAHRLVLSSEETGNAIFPERAQLARIVGYCLWQMTS